MERTINVAPVQVQDGEVHSTPLGRMCVRTNQEGYAGKKISWPVEIGFRLEAGCLNDGYFLCVPPKINFY